MIATYLIFISTAVGWFAFLTFAVYFSGRRLGWMSKPPAIDVIVTLFTVAPWIAGWLAGMRIHGHWWGGVPGLVAMVVSQMLALELFDYFHLRQAASRGIRSLNINKSIERRFGKWNNRLCLWLTVPSIPFFLMNRVTFAGYFIFENLLGFKHFEPSDYIVVSRQKIQNLIGADLVWCLYCDWMTGAWTMSTEMLNEVESYWCPLLFADRGKCEKCSKHFRMEHWVSSGCSAEEMDRVAGMTGNRPPVPIKPVQEVTR